jgi:hypothetical protein
MQSIFMVRSNVIPELCYVRRGIDINLFEYAKERNISENNILSIPSHVINMTAVFYDIISLLYPKICYMYVGFEVFTAVTMKNVVF